MTWGGGKPHAVGDNGQQYEVSYEDSLGARKVFGWATTLQAAERMCESIDLHPSMRKPEIRNRKP